MFNIAIVEDNIENQNELKEKIIEISEKLNIKYHIKIFGTGKDFLNDFNAYHLIFLDMILPDLSGMEIANVIKEKYGESLLIITSASDDFLIDGYKVNAFRYLLKPLKDNDFLEAIQSALEILHSKMQIKIKSNNEYVIINVEDICYLEAIDHEVLIRIENGHFSVAKRMCDFELLLDNGDFFRTHKSYMINFRFIESYSNKYIVLNNGEKVKISKNKYREFEEKYERYKWINGSR